MNILVSFNRTETSHDSSSSHRHRYSCMFAYAWPILAFIFHSEKLCAFREGGSTKKLRRRKQAQPKSESEDEESDGDFGMEPLPSPTGSAPPGSSPTVSPVKNEPPCVVCCLCLCGLLSMSGLLIPGVICIPVRISSLCLVLGFVLSVCCVACDITVASLLCCSLRPSLTYIAVLVLTPCCPCTACECWSLPEQLSIASNASMSTSCKI